MSTPEIPLNLNPVGQVWQRLTRPHPNLTDIQTRRQSRLLAGLTLMLITTSGIAALGMVIRSSGIPTIVLLLLPSQLLTLGLYLLNRRGNYQTSATVFVVYNFILIHLAPLGSGEVAWLFFMPMVLLLSAMLMPVNITIGMYLSSIVLQIGLWQLRPISTEMTNFSALVIFMVTASLVLVFMNHRSRLEAERQHELRIINQRLRESEANLEQRVIERTRELTIAKQEADAARLRAEESDHVKSQFLASMSHELRTPLNAILTFNELMAIGTFGPVNEEQIDYLHKSMYSGRHLLSLINDVLDITKIHAGMLKLFVENDFDIGQEMDTIATTAAKMLLDKPVQLVRDFQPDFPPLACDKRRVRQVLLNLVSNAVKFTESGTITLSIQHKNDAVVFRVADTGPGIQPDQHALIFEPFVQTETGIRHAGGTGLGLPISKRLVEAHGGQLWLESTPGQGSTFWVSLPLQPALELGEKELA